MMELLTTINIIVGFAGLVVAAFIAYLLQKSLNQRKEQIDEYKKNIERVEYYVNDYFDAANLIMDLEGKIIMMNTIDDCPPILDKIEDFVKQARKNSSYIKLLQDSEIINLETEWVQTIWAEKETLFHLINSIDIHKPINKEMELSRVRLFNRKIALLQHKLKSRLNDLASNAKY